MAVTVSEKPWSDYTKADYTPEQWHASCLIHQHEGAPTSKAQCKLPVKTPSGTLNRNGVHAAAAALAGARGGVDASPEEKAKAARALRGYYSQLGEEPPDSLKHSAVEEFFAHFGVKGMQWGVRRSPAALARSSAAKADRAARKTGKITKGAGVDRRDIHALKKGLSPEKGKVQRAHIKEASKAAEESAKGSRAAAKEATTKASAKLLKGDAVWANQIASGLYLAEQIGPSYRRATKRFNATDVPRINSQAKYKNADFRKDSPLRQRYYKEHQDAFMKAFNDDVATSVAKSPSGNKELVLTRPKTNDYSTPIPVWAVTVKDVVHAIPGGLPRIRVIFDDMGFIEKFVVEEDEMAQDDVSEFFEHFGVKGMKWGVRRSDAQLSSKPTPSEDKARATEVASKVVGRGDTSALSNQELQSLVTRMNLESQYSKLINRPKPTPQTVKYIKTGAKFATTALAVGTFANRAYAFSKSPAGQRLVKELSKSKTKVALAKSAKAAADTGQGVLF